MPSYTDAVKGQVFKHLDTTKLIAIRFVDQDGNYATPNPDHKWTAKIAIESGQKPGYIGDYPAYPAADSLIVQSKDLVKLVPGEYRLEAWETYTDSDEETTIWPTPASSIEFTIEPNITDQAGEMVTKITFQDVVNSAVIAAGMNIVIAGTQTLPAGSQAKVEQKLVDGKNQFTFYLPAGKTGDKGDTGDTGATGKSAYEVAVDNGFTGTSDDFIKSLKGDKGDQGVPGKDGKDGVDGKSAYQVWLDAGNKGTEDDYLKSLKGDQGDKGNPGETGATGKSAYQVWLDTGNTGTEADYLKSLKGDKGDQGVTGNDGPRGFQGPAGKSFQIKKTFASIQAMNDSKGADFDDGDFTLISSTVEDPDNAKLYVWDGSKFNFVGDLSSAQGIAGPTGPAPTIHVGTVTKLNPDQQPTFTFRGEEGNYYADVGLPAGQTGATGKMPDITVGNITKLAAGSTPVVNTHATDTGYSLDFALPEGAQGVAGQPGKTPVAGTDYFTDADKQSFLDSLKKYVDDDIENGEW